MKTIKNITTKTSLFKKLFLRTLKSETFNSKSELNHPRFHINENYDLKSNIGHNSLLFHMYSKENDTLFI